MKKSLLTLIIPALVLTFTSGCRLETEDLNPQPIETYTPVPSNGDAPNIECRYYDGDTDGISRRGWHAVKIVQGVHYSVEYFNSASTYAGDRVKCYEKLLNTFEKDFYLAQVIEYKKTTCACRWFDGDENKPELGSAGWHLSYKINIVDLKKMISPKFFSALYFNSASTYAGDEENCKRKLVELNFACP